MAGIGQMFDLKDEKQAKEYLDRIGIEYRFQCYEEKRSDGCHRLADFFEAFRRDYPRARRVFGKNCLENGHGKSCFKFGNYSLLGKGGEKDLVAARDAFRKACEYGDAGGCFNAATMAMQSETKETEGRDFKMAATFLKRACDELKDSESCHLLSTFYIAGHPGVGRDMTKAYEYAMKACDMNHIGACAHVSIMHRKGDGVEMDAAKAEEFKRKALDLERRIKEYERSIEFGK